MTSPSDDDLFSRYRDELAMGSQARARTFRKLQERVARGDLPRPEMNVAPPSVPATQGAWNIPVGWTAAVLGITAVVVVGANLDTGWQRPRLQRVQPTAAMKAVSEPSRGSGSQRSAAGAAQVAPPATSTVGADTPDARPQTSSDAPAAPASSTSSATRALSAARSAAPTRAADGRNDAARAQQLQRSRVELHTSSAPTDGGHVAVQQLQRGRSDLRKTSAAADEGHVAVQQLQRGRGATGMASAPAAPKPLGRSAADSDLAAASDEHILQLSAATPPPQPAATTTNPAAPARPATPERSVETPAPETLVQEVRLLQAAQLALRAGDPQRALALLAEHTWTFPRGQLAEARDVARIIALCQAGSVAQSQQHAKRFLQQRPQSPYALRVRAGCAALSDVAPAQRARY